MAFTFAINGHTYTSDPANTGVAAGYHFDGYNYMTALGNLCGDLVAVAAAVVSDKNTTAGSASTAAASAGAASGSATTATTQAGNASASASAALASQNLAADWADKLTEVVTGRYSAKYWATQAQASVTGQLVYRGGWDASGNTYPAAPATGDFYKITVAGTPSGGEVNIGDDIIYNGATWDVIDNTQSSTITGFSEIYAAVAASEINLLLGNYFSKTISATTTFTLANIPASGIAIAFILELTNAGGYTVNWFSGVKWAGGAAPTLTASGVDSLGFYTTNGGTTWRGVVIGKDIK